LRLSYSIPLIGLVEIKLGKYPMQFYQFLEKKNEIGRLQNLEHLGVLQSLFPGMHHTRWDYTNTMLYLVQQFAESKLEGLSTEKKINGLSLSGRDIMQLLALSANIGHLPGTFAVEKGVMRYLAQNSNDAERLFKEAGLSRDGINKIDYININKLLILVKLKLWNSDDIKEEDRRILNALKTLWYEMFFAVPKTKHREKIFSYFNFVRRVSYQLLDCLYVNLPLKVDYSRFINQLPELLLQKEQLNTIAELTDHYTRIVYREIYHSNEACNVVASWADKVHKFLSDTEDILKIIKKWLSKGKLDDFVGQPSFNMGEIFSCRLSYKIGESFLIDSFLDYQVEKIENNIMRLLKDKSALILYIPDLKDPFSDSTTAGDLLFNVYANEGNNEKRDLLLTLGLILVWLHRDFKDNWGVGVIAKAVIEKIIRTLSLIDKLKVVIELPPDILFKNEFNFVNEDRIQILSASQRRRILDDLYRSEKSSWEKNVKEQFAECKVLKELARKKWRKPRRGVGQYWVIVPGRIKFIDAEKNRDKCEYDGALLRIVTKKNKITEMILYLVEAKTGYSTSSSRAMTELKKKLMKLGIQFRYIKKLEDKSAYAGIHIV